MKQELKEFELRGQFDNSTHLNGYISNQTNSIGFKMKKITLRTNSTNFYILNRKHVQANLTELNSENFKTDKMLSKTCSVN